MRRFLCGILCLGLITFAHADEGPLKSSPIAKLFGSHPDIRSVRLSPDGSKLLFLKTHPEGYSIVTVLDLTGPKLTGVINSDKDKNDIQWCRWANEERLLCAYVIQSKLRGRRGDWPRYITLSRLVGVNGDGTEVKVLLEDRLQGEFSQIQTNVLDWLGDDPDHVLIQIPKTRGTGVGIMDVYTGRYTTKERIRDGVYSWISDGHGKPRLYQRGGMSKSTWHLISPGKLSNEILREISLGDMDNVFAPQGFGENPDELLYFNRHDGRVALFGMNLAGDDRSTRLVYAHPRVDIASLHRLGKYNRLVGVIFAEETVHQHYFDEEIRRFHDQIKSHFPSDNVTVADEDWNRRNYLVVISSDINPGTYYHFDRQENKLNRIGPLYSSLKDRELSRMSIISYTARNGTEIPAYLSLPASGEKTGLPAVILPHGGPSSRDVWGFDFLVQYLTAKGYAVLQTNYRGSAGYGKEWLGDGAFRNWRTAIDDITDGVKYLVDEGIADAGRICAVGWSFGGYAALMSGIEEPDRYRCIVSIAGVTNPQRLGWVSGRSARTFIGTDEEVTKRGSPVNRAAEIQDPVLLVHAEKDVNVPFSQSKLMLEALQKHGKSVEFITYENAEHSIIPERYRIDLLTRLGEFLDRHTK
jgi:dipeptidyl aminopeptidase/acylaminoacyl peptidase